MIQAPRITLHLAPGYDRQYAPIPATKIKNWWDDNARTRDHAKHCLPLAMANSLGYYILSPATFIVRWDGSVHNQASLEILERCSHCIVDTHAVFGGFVVQASFIPRTEFRGDFVIIKGMPNERDLPYTCAEAAIEAWWSPAKFGLVYTLHKAGEFIINIGSPIAQMYLYKGAAGAAEIDLADGWPSETHAWQARRGRPDYKKDLDYTKGLLPDGTEVGSHITGWAKATQYGFPFRSDT